jgi:hypothetical protein
LTPSFHYAKSGKIMTRLGLLVFLGLTFLAAGRTEAGSAVASGPFGEHVIGTGKNYSKQAAIKKALVLWHRQWTGTPKILASTDVYGEGAVAAWNDGKAWAIGASVGKTTAAEAKVEAMKYCLDRCPKGAKPTILRQFRG